MSADLPHGSALQARVAELEAENRHLRHQLQQSQDDVFYLLRWLRQVQRDIDDVYRSVTWRIGDRITKLILKILRKPPGPTARDHIERVTASIAAWEQDYWQAHPSLPYTPWHSPGEYAAWIARFDTPGADEKARMLAATPGPSYSLILSVPSTYRAEWLAETLASVVGQLYPHWQLLCLVPENCAAEVPADERIEILRHAPDEARSTLLNRALAHARGDFISLVDAHDRLAGHALFLLSEALDRHPGALLAYSDEDCLDEQGRRCDPYFKPDWDPDLFHARHYLRHLTAYRREAVIRAGGFPACEGAEDYALLLHMLEPAKAEDLRHVAHVLYHRRHAAPPDPAPRMEALRAHFRATQPNVEIQPAPGGHVRVRYPVAQPAPLVSVIIPTRDRLELLLGTVEGVLQYTDYAPLELIIVDNGSREAETLDYLAKLKKDSRIKVLRHDAPFNYSQLNNLAAGQARGTILALLNNDLRMIRRDWLAVMVAHALRPEIGAVGAKLYYADDTIQHAGVVSGMGGLAGHPFKRMPRQAPGYQWQLSLTHDAAAVTAACLVLRREVFTHIGGFDEHLRVAFNDVDLCLRIRRSGYRIVWTPDAELYHLESASRGMDDTPAKYLQLQKEITYMRKRWGAFLAIDPYYNPNLTLQYEDYGLAWPPSH